jgi:hypothetical protein
MMADDSNEVEMAEAANAVIDGDFFDHEPSKQEKIEVRRNGTFSTTIIDVSLLAVSKIPYERIIPGPREIPFLWFSSLFRRGACLNAGFLLRLCVRVPAIEFLLSVQQASLVPCDGIPSFFRDGDISVR